MKIRIAKGPISVYMKLCGFRGWASFWETIYLMPGSERDAALLRHELEHLRQIRRDGRIKFATKYLWFLVRYGYKKNPYEVQARKAESLF